MAIPKKGSRSIVLDQRKYRWSVRRTEEDWAWNEYGMQAVLTVAVEDFACPAGVLCIRHECGLNYGKEKERLRLVSTGMEMRIGPGQVEEWIRIALARGWNPQAKGSKLLINL